jgi:hypothetical protein
MRKRTLRETISSLHPLFNDDERDMARNLCGLSADTIDELEQMVVSEFEVTLFFRQSHPTKELKRHLRKVDAALATAIAELDSDQLFENRKSPLLAIQYQQLNEIRAAVNATLSQTVKKPGNQPTDLSDLVFVIALVLTRSGIRVSRYGRKFNETVNLVFRAINETGANAAISKAWPRVASMLQHQDRWYYLRQIGKI